MADPNFAAVMEMIAFAAKVLDEHETYASTASTGVLATTEALRNDLEGDWAQSVRDVVQSVRSSTNQPLTKAGARAIFDPLLRQAAVAIGTVNPQESIEIIWEKLVDYMVTNSQTLNDSEDTIDTTWSADGGNVGNATVFLLTTDENGEKLGALTDTWTLKCVADARTLGQAQIEQWELRGTDRRPDNLDYAGTGLVESVRTLSADLSQSYVRNPSFNKYDVDGSNNLTGLDGWTQSGAQLQTNLSINTTYSARTTPGDSSEASLQFDADETIVQDLVDVKGAQIDPDTPFMISIGVAKVGTPTGTILLRLSGTTGSGGSSASIAAGSMTGGGTFDRLQITSGNACWPKTWNANDLKLQVQLTTGASMDASNYFVVDDIVFAPLTRIGDFGDPRAGRGSMGTYIGVTGGSTPAALDDTYTATDSLGGTRGVNHWALTKIAQYGCLPLQTGGTETIADK